MILGEALLSNFATALASWSVFSTFSVRRIFLFGTPYFIATSLRYSPSGFAALAYDSVKRQGLDDGSSET